MLGGDGYWHANYWHTQYWQQNYWAELGAGASLDARMGIVTPYYTHLGMDYAGAADREYRNSDLAGNVDGQRGTLSFWFRIDGGDGTAMTILTDSFFRTIVQRDSNNNWTIRVSNAAAAGIGVATANVPFGFYTQAQAGGTWHHMAASWDLSVPIMNGIWYDGVLAAGGNVAVNDTIRYLSPDWAVGARGTGVGAWWWNGAISELYFNNTEYIDLSVQANRELFRHPNLQPRSLDDEVGADNGAGPTGHQPIVYMVEVGGAMVNLGSGGAFVTQGAPTLSADSPKDRWAACLRHRRRKRRRHAA